MIAKTPVHSSRRRNERFNNDGYSPIIGLFVNGKPHPAYPPRGYWIGYRNYDDHYEIWFDGFRISCPTIEHRNCLWQILCAITHPQTAQPLTIPEHYVECAKFVFGDLLHSRAYRTRVRTDKSEILKDLYRVLSGSLPAPFNRMDILEKSLKIEINHESTRGKGSSFVTITSPIIPIDIIHDAMWSEALEIKYSLDCYWGL